VREPRKVFFTRLDEDQPCVMQSSNPGYAPMMWPLAFPSGSPAELADGSHVDSRHRMQDATLAMLFQPERNENGEFVTVMTPSPYGTSHPNVPRRFSRFELMGRLGDEFLLDRWLSVLDQRLKTLASKTMQRRLVGRFHQDDRDRHSDGADVEVGGADAWRCSAPSRTRDC